VLLREDSPGLKQLIGYVVTTDPQQFDIAAALAVAGQTLPDYMLPTTLVALAEMPLTPNGKIDRNALPAPEQIGDTTVYVGPRNETEEQLANLWSELLGAERIGIHDDFFGLGGHSLVAMQLVSRVMETMRIELPLDALFNAPTIAGLTARIAAVATEQDPDSVETAATTSIKAISRSARRTRRPRKK